MSNLIKSEDIVMQPKLTEIDCICEELTKALSYCEQLREHLDNIDSNKNIPRKMESYNDIRICPSCDKVVHSIYNYCCHCGQKFYKEGQDEN